MNQNKDKILQAASALFLEGGTAALSVRAIAKRAGVSTIGIYSHFEGKQGILDALYGEGFARVAEAMDVMQPGMSTREAVLVASANYLQFAEVNEAHYRLIFGESNGSYVPSAAAKAEAIKAFAGLTNLVAQAFPSLPSQTSRKQLALRIWALLHGSVSLKHHAVAELVDMRDWQTQALTSVEIFINAVTQDTT
jgi:AcrR family transcriptional regulator